ncbi:Chemotaxis protein methyltransferase [Trichlorobacter ammonificans]|uniref:protein-glutamate O-methyltransferase n=2 Tax=Trichlorobacter ammonificans TaxID=2916410 RepID=A0ABM9D9Z1_9BACT|nr:Chemotaxis protein methyltransferase [Trichlorobacter ammonificans]
MTEEEFLLLRDLVYDHCGLWFDSHNSYLLEKRLTRRLVVHNFSTFLEYYQFLKLSRKRTQELDEIMDILTTNETYFFREAFQLKAFSEEIVPELRNSKEKAGTSRTLRIWSAGCSSGEEPYTIAMLLLELPFMRDWKVEIVGTDISQRVLQQARRGVYGQSSFRTTDDYFTRQYFVRQDDGFRISDRVRELVTISHLNLLDQNRIGMLGNFDVVFCRNVIIYFDPAAKKQVVESFHQVLNQGGYLLLGHSESLMNVTTKFMLRHFKNDMVYQKPVNGGVL